MYFKCTTLNNSNSYFLLLFWRGHWDRHSTSYQRRYFNVRHSYHVTGHVVAQGHRYFPVTSHLSRFSESSCYVKPLCKQLRCSNFPSPISNSVESDKSLSSVVTGYSDVRRSIVTGNFNFSFGKENYYYYYYRQHYLRTYYPKLCGPVAQSV